MSTPQPAQAAPAAPRIHVACEACATLTSSNAAPVAVVGVGSALFGDDGFGPATVALLEAGWEWPDSVALIQAATAGAELATLLRGRTHAIVLDAVQADAAPGTLVSWQRDALLHPRSARDRCLTPQDPRIRAAFERADAEAALPADLLLIGVVPVSTMLGAMLSPVVEVASRIAALEVVRRLQQWGVDARKRVTSTSIDRGRGRAAVV